MNAFTRENATEFAPTPNAKHATQAIVTRPEEHTERNAKRKSFANDRQIDARCVKELEAIGCP